MRVLFTTQPGDGHFNPLVPLAQALVKAGHDVAFACAPRFCATVETRGFRAFPVGLDWTIGKGGPKWTELWPELLELPAEHGNEFVAGRMFAGDVAEQALPEILALTRAWSPDIVVRETWEFGGWLASEVLSLPCVSVEVTPFAFHAAYTSAVETALKRILDRIGQSSLNIWERLFSRLHLAFIPPSFSDPAVPLPATTQFLRPLLLDPLPGELPPPWLAGLPRRPTVYATGGTAGKRIEFFASVLPGMRELDANIIATTGQESSVVDPEQQSKNVHLVEYISQALLLPHCDVVVTHGGFSSVAGALIVGLPLVILPNGADRFVNARRAAMLGAAIELGADNRTPEAIRAAVETVLSDPSYRQRAREIQAEIQALPGPGQGVTLLEQLVAAQRPMLRA